MKISSVPCHSDRLQWDHRPCWFSRAWPLFRQSALPHQTKHPRHHQWSLRYRGENLQRISARSLHLIPLLQRRSGIRWESCTTISCFRCIFESPLNQYRQYWFTQWVRNSTRWVRKFAQRFRMSRCIFSTVQCNIRRIYDVSVHTLVWNLWCNGWYLWNVRWTRWYLWNSWCTRRFLLNLWCTRR